MLGLGLVRALEDDWRDTLDSVARRYGWPASDEVRGLAACVVALSSAYNDPAVARAAVRDAGAARLGFSFPRDVPKGAAAVRELVATGMVKPPGAGPLRVLDVGAGLGATTWGLVRALAASRERRRRAPSAPSSATGSAGRVGDAVLPPLHVHATWVDSDARALEIGAELVRARAGGRTGATVTLDVTTVAQPGPRMHSSALASMHALDDPGRYDVVLVGQLLSELDVGEPPDVRVDLHAALLGELLERRVDAHGSLVVIEPALRDRTRHLHRVRDVLAARGVTVFAPCLHAAPCPALARDTDWCHEDLPVDLPRWLVPVARAAGLRHEGLTFSYLVLRNDGERLSGHLAAPPGAARLRVVSELMRTKGKRDAFVCGELSVQGGAPVAGRVRATRLDRDTRAGNAVWGDLVRGDLLIVDPPPVAAASGSPPRIGAEGRVVRSDDAETR
jgi:hypothetical protein